MDPKRKGAVRRCDSHIAVCLNDEKKLSCEYGGEIRYHIRAKRYIEWSVTLTSKLSKFRGVKWSSF